MELLINMKCFEHHNKNKSNCEKSTCRYWINCKESQNCCIIGADTDKKFTLEDVGNIFNVTRMRICQVEKIAINKLRDKVYSILSL